MHVFIFITKSEKMCTTAEGDLPAATVSIAWKNKHAFFPLYN